MDEEDGVIVEDEGTVVVYVCSRCGYSRRSSGAVVEHIVDQHDGEGTVREHERERDWRDALVEWIRDLTSLR